jgi:hypothetical protein
MAEFHFEDTSGQKFVVEAPDLDTAVTAFKKLAGEKAVSDPYANRKGSFLPLSTDAQGDLHFDATAGVLGSIISGFTAPGDVVSGKLDPNSPEGMQRAMDTTGLMLGVNPMVASGDRAIPGALKALTPGKPQIPTAKALSEAGGAGYEAARQMGVDYSPDAVTSLMQGVQTTLEQKGLRDIHAPEVFSILRAVQKPPVEEGATTVASLSDLLSVRDALGSSAGNILNKRESKAATTAIRELDTFLEGSDPASVVAGPAAAAAAALKEANANLAAGHRSDAITSLLRKAERRAATTNSGLNVGNTVRQKIASLLEKPKDLRGYSKEEIELLEKIAAGSKAANASRYVGNLLGGGGGLGASVPAAIGGALGATLGPAGAAAGAATPVALGYALRNIASSLTKREVELLDELIRKRSPLYKKATENPPMDVISADARLAPLRLLGLVGGQEQQ